MAGATIALIVGIFVFFDIGLPGGSDEDEIRDRAGAYLEALTSGKSEEACDSLSDTAIESLLAVVEAAPQNATPALVGGSCEEAIASISASLAEDQREIDFVALADDFDVEFQGDRAVASDSANPPQISLQFEQVDGEWLVANLGPFLFIAPSSTAASGRKFRKYVRKQERELDARNDCILKKLGPDPFPASQKELDAADRRCHEHG